jgi:hypothetical protein
MCRGMYSPATGSDMCCRGVCTVEVEQSQLPLSSVSNLRVGTRCQSFAERSRGLPRKRDFQKQTSNVHTICYDTRRRACDPRPNTHDVSALLHITLGILHQTHLDFDLDICHFDLGICHGVHQPRQSQTPVTHEHTNQSATRQTCSHKSKCIWLHLISVTGAGSAITAVARPQRRRPPPRPLRRLR